MDIPSLRLSPFSLSLRLRQLKDMNRERGRNGDDERERDPKARFIAWDPLRSIRREREKNRGGEEGKERKRVKKEEKRK